MGCTKIRHTHFNGLAPFAEEAELRQKFSPKTKDASKYISLPVLLDIHPLVYPFGHKKFILVPLAFFYHLRFPALR